MCSISMSEKVLDPPKTTLDPKLSSMLEIQAPDDKNFIYCAACSHVIGHTKDQLEIRGQHAHILTNPHGFVFHVGCFSNALGCEISGTPEAADTWFMGYAWQIATCAECHTHLGWYFTSTGRVDYFYGLILDRIQQDN